jgi:hypothetical protein
MTKDEIIQEFITILRDEVIYISAIVITWPSVHTPESRWETVAILDANATQEEIDAGIDEVLANPEYFRICHHCGEINAIGHMGKIELNEEELTETNTATDIDNEEEDENYEEEEKGVDVCMGCMEAHYGVVF